MFGLDVGAILIAKALGFDKDQLVKRGTQEGAAALKRVLNTQFRQAMEPARTNIKKKLAARERTPKEDVREILFLTAKHFVKSGDIADAFRDTYDDEILEELSPILSQGMPMVDDGLITQVFQALADKVF